MPAKICIAILEDHQSTIDGYRYRIEQSSHLEIVETGRFGDDLRPILAKHQVDVLILDMVLPISPEDRSPFPVFFELPRILQQYPELAVIVISAHSDPTIIRSIMEAGARGYILKEDFSSVVKIAQIIDNVFDGGLYLSPQASDIFMKRTPAVTITPRQLEVLSLLAADPNLTTREVADKIFVAESTVRNTLSDVYERLDVRNRSAAVIKAQQLGLLPNDLSPPPALG